MELNDKRTIKEGGKDLSMANTCGFDVAALDEKSVDGTSCTGVHVLQVQYV